MKGLNDKNIKSTKVEMKLKVLCVLLIALCFYQSSLAQPTVSKKKFHLFLLAGQSNMAGRGTVEAADTVTNSKIWMLDKQGEWQLAKEPLHFDKPGIAGVGPGFAFAKKMAEQDSTVYIGLIPCAVGGSPVAMWAPGKYYEPTKSYPYDDAMRRTKLAIQSGVLKGILWHQGESDSDSLHAMVYNGKLIGLVQRFRKDLKTKSLPFVAGTIEDFYAASHPFIKHINAAIKGLPQRLKRIAVVHTEGLTHKGDVTHFNTASAREVGKRYAEVFIHTFNNNNQ